jgi:hypothetical protein
MPYTKPTRNCSKRQRKKHVGTAAGRLILFQVLDWYVLPFRWF